jgi:hypothetical protein
VVQVFEALDVRTGELVAVKELVLPASPSGQEVLLPLFQACRASGASSSQSYLRAMMIADAHPWLAAAMAVVKRDPSTG